MEGKLSNIDYQTNKGGTRTSVLEIVRNYQMAIAQIGGETLFDNKAHIFNMNMRLLKNGKEVWVKVDAVLGQYTLVIVERKAMAQSVTAQAIFDELNQKDFMVIDVYFDTA